MNVTDLIQGALNEDTVGRISQVIGADQGATGTAIQSALPIILGGLARNSANESGAESLVGALDRDHDGSILDDLAGFVGNYNQANGAGILGHIFGGQQSAVEQTVSQSSGLDMSKVGPLLTILAPIVMGALGKSRRDEGIGVSDLAGILSGSTQQMSSGSPVVDILSQVLDRNRDGSAVDDVFGMLGNILGRK